MAETVVGMHVMPGGKSVPKVKAAQRNGWTEKRERRFLDHLAATCNVSASLREVGATAALVYRHRQKSAQFRAAWDHALSEGYARLEAMLLDRALNGRRVTVERAGKMIETIEYSDTLALRLLALHHRQVADVRAAAVVPREDPAIVRERIVAQIMTVVAAVPDRMPARVPDDLALSGPPPSALIEGPVAGQASEPSQ